MKRGLVKDIVKLAIIGIVVLVLIALIVCAATGNNAKIVLFGRSFPPEILIFLIVLVLFYVFVALTPAYIAKDKGYSFWGFFVFGLCLILPALIVALCLNKKDTTQQLLNLKKLLDEGVITQDEFDAKRAELL
jgi:hypothetical protein